MPSTKIKVDEFLKSSPKCTSFVNDVIKKEDDVMKKEIEKDNKEELLEKAKQLFEYDIENLRRPVLSGSKYKLDLLNKEDADYKLLKSTFSLNDPECTPITKEIMNQLTGGKINVEDKTRALKIYRVTDKTPTESNDSTSFMTSQNVLLLHGTKASNVEGILMTGFDPSRKGSHGPGLYLTDSFSFALQYGRSFARERGIVKKFRHVFVNKVKPVYEPLPKNQSKKQISFEEYLQKKPVVQIFDALTRKPASFEDSATNKHDSNNLKILQGTFQRGYENEKIALAHHDLVVPTYLIEFEEKESAKEMAEEALFRNLNLEKYTQDFERFEKYQKLEKTSNEYQEVTLTAVTKALVNEINANHDAKVKHLMSNRDDYIESIIKQLSFKISTFIETKDDKSLKYQAEFLNVTDEDYNFVLRSIENDRSVAACCKVLHILKINPVDKNEVAKLKGERLLFNGMKSNEINKILTSGYPSHTFFTRNIEQVLRKHKILQEFSKLNEHFCTATDCLKHEISKGSSYCAVGNLVEADDILKLDDVVVDDVIKKVSFVFVSSTENATENKFDNKEFRTDSRGSFLKKIVKMSGNKKCNWENVFTCTIPAYLVVFELNDDFEC